MAVTVRNAQSIGRSGLAPAYTAVDNTNGEACVNDGYLFVHLKNTGGAACTVSFDLPNAVDGQLPPDRTVVVPATTGDRMVGPFPTGTYNQPDNTIVLAFSTGTGVTAAYVHLG